MFNVFSASLSLAISENVQQGERHMVHTILTNEELALLYVTFTKKKKKKSPSQYLLLVLFTCSSIECAVMDSVTAEEQLDGNLLLFFNFAQ